MKSSGPCWHGDKVTLQDALRRRRHAGRLGGCMWRFVYHSGIMKYDLFQFCISEASISIDVIDYQITTKLAIRAHESPSCA